MALVYGATGTTQIERVAAVIAGIVMGYRPRDLARALEGVGISLIFIHGRTREQVVGFYKDTMRRIAELPGVVFTSLGNRNLRPERSEELELRSYTILDGVVSEEEMGEIAARSKLTAIEKRPSAVEFDDM